MKSDSRIDGRSQIAARITGEWLVTKITRCAPHPRHDEIARLAYAIYTARGAHDGEDITDWLRAERELLRG